MADRTPFRRRGNAALRVLRGQGASRRDARRSLTAAAMHVDLSDRAQARKMRQLRMGWQSQAWDFRDQIGELRFAVNFLGNCAARMKLFPAAYSADGETDSPVPISDVPGFGPNLIDLAMQSISDLGNGRVAISGMLKQLSENATVAGEAWLLGQEDPTTGQDRYTIRSVDEIVITESEYKLRELPNQMSGDLGWVTLDPDATYLERMWLEHPRYRLWADSALRAILDDCESLLILRRGIRAAGRSRLAGAGFLLVPEGLTIKRAIDDNEDPEADPFMGQLAEAMMEPIADEGVASAVVPIAVRGAAEALKEFRLLLPGRDFDKLSIEIRQELVGVIATGLDLPREIVEGSADLNHWSKWAVDDDTFRHHVEPHVMQICHLLTEAYFRPYLISAGVAPEQAARALYWYDPSELVTHPDRSAEAEKAYAAMVISEEAYRRDAGFAETDKPTLEELEARRLWDIRALPLNLLMEYARRTDPSLVVPPITVSGTVPGIKPGGVDVGDLPPAPVPPAGGTPPTAPAPGPSKPALGPAAPGPPAMTAAAAQARAFAVPTDADGEPTGVMVAFYLAPDLAASIAVAGGEAPDDLHLTLAFLGEARSLPDPNALRTAVRSWAAGRKPVTGEISGVGLFTAGDDPVTYVSIDAPDLPALRQSLIDALAGQPVANDHGFTPHVTLAYEDRLGDANVGGETVTFDAVSVCIGGDRTDYKLGAMAASSASARATQTRLSRRLVSIDQDLRARLQVAANAAMLRQLERAGAKIVTHLRSASNETMRVKIAHTRLEHVAGVLGRDALAAAGVSVGDLLSTDWSSLHPQFLEWTEAAATAAVTTACKLAGLDSNGDEAAAATAAFAVSRDAGWTVLENALTTLGQNLLYNPDPQAAVKSIGELNPNTLVPTGTIRAALGVAGGTKVNDLGIDSFGLPTIPLGTVVGQIGTGATITDLVTGAGVTSTGWFWTHGPALHGFEPHQDLDGLEFDSFTDPALANTTGFPDTQWFLAGDHSGCTCDVSPLWNNDG